MNPNLKNKHVAKAGTALAEGILFAALATDPTKKLAMWAHVLVRNHKGITTFSGSDGKRMHVYFVGNIVIDLHEGWYKVTNRGARGVEYVREHPIGWEGARMDYMREYPKLIHDKTPFAAIPTDAVNFPAKAATHIAIDRQKVVDTDWLKDIESVQAKFVFFGSYDDMTPIVAQSIVTSTPGRKFVAIMQTYKFDIQNKEYDYPQNTDSDIESLERI